MFSKKIIGLMVLGILVVGLCGCAGSRGTFDGAWEKVVPEEGDVGLRAVKILTNGHFAFGCQSADGNINWSGGGYFTYDDNKYTETVTYHWNPLLVGAKIEFDYLVEDGVWTHKAKFQRQGEWFNIDEVWERKEPTPSVE